MIEILHKIKHRMKVKTIIDLAWSFFRPRPRGIGSGVYLLGSTLGIGVSLVPLVLVVEISDGLIEGITERYLELGSYHLQISLPNLLWEKDGLDRKVVDAVAKGIQSNSSEVILSVRENQGVAIAVTENAQNFVTVRSISKNLYLVDQGFNKYIEMFEGAFDLSGNGIVVAKAVAENLNLRLFDKLILVTDGFNAGSRAPLLVPLVVRGIFSTGYQQLDQLWVFVSSETGGRVLSSTLSKEFIGIKVKSPFKNLSNVINEISKFIGTNYSIRTWEEIEKNNYESFSTSRALLILIMSLIVLVACVNITSASVTLSLSRRQEIACLKCMGLSPVEVFLSVVLTGLFVGTLGALIGVSLGILISLNINEIIFHLEQVTTIVRDIISYAIVGNKDSLHYSSIVLVNRDYYLQEIPVNVESVHIVLIIFGTVALSLLATMFPAYQASRRLPIEIMNRSD